MGFGWCFVGLDLGQSHDSTAITVLERAELVGEWQPVVYAWKKIVSLQLRFLERIPLGTPYPSVVRRVRDVVRSPELVGRCTLIVDATGVGRPVVDLLKDQELGCRIMPVMITGGEQETSLGSYYGVPKRDLIVGLQVLLQRGGLRIAAGMKDCALLVKEMANMRVRVTPAGREQFETWREGDHDDMVLATALACWGAQKIYPSPLYGDDAYWRRTLEQPNLREGIPKGCRR